MASQFGNTSHCTSRFCESTDDPYQILPPIQGYEQKPLVSLEEAVRPIRHLVAQIEQMVHNVKMQCRRRKTNLSLDESAGIMLYTLEWSTPETSLYFTLNNTLRSKDRRQLIPWFSYLRLLLSALAKLPACTPRLLYRGIKTNQSELYITGEECTWWSFSSCTTSLRVLETFIGKEDERTIFNIHCRSAIDISEYSFHQTEQEVLLYPGRQLKVGSLLDAGNGLCIIDLVETEPPYPLFRMPISPAVNILVLAEAGAGKTTFINALVNYLEFPTFERAQSGSTLALKPLSFEVTLTDDFEQRTIRLGDRSTYEDRSYQQRCQSYTTELHQMNEMKLCIIDTPSFESSQENDSLEFEMNMDHISNYVKELTHLDAICLILKSNKACLDTLQPNFTRLIHLLGPAAHRNIIFCFTHAHTRFFTPGSAATVIRRILDSPSMEDIPFSRENSFFFDNRALRYLLVLKDGIHLNNIDPAEYTAAWSECVAESNRLLQHIRTQLTPMKMNARV